MSESKRNYSQNYGSIPPPPPPTNNITPQISNNKNLNNNPPTGIADISTLTDEDDETLFAGLKGKDDLDEQTIITNTSTSLLIPHSLALSPDTTLKSINTNERSILLPNITNLNGNRHNTTTPASNIDEYDYYSTLSTMTTNTKKPPLHNILCSRSSCLIVFLMIIFTMTLNYSSNLWESKSKTIKDAGDTSAEDVYFGNYDVLRKNLPFKGVERKEFGDGVKSVIDFDLLDDDLLFSPPTTTTTSDFGATNMKSKRLKSPLPTQAFWTNLILKNTSSNYPVVTYPYAYRWTNKTGLEMCYPYNYRQENNDGKTITDVFYPDLSFLFVEELNKRKIMEYTGLSVTLRFMSNANDDDDGFMETYLVQGTPYTTIKYNSVSPVLSTLHLFNDVSCLSTLATKNGLCTVNADTNVYQGVQFILSISSSSTIQNPIYYILIASEPLLLQLSADKTKLTYISTPNSPDKTYTGVLRIALLPNYNPETKDSNMLLKQLLHYSSTYPTGVRLSIGYSRNVISSIDTATVTFIYNAENIHSIDTPSTTTKASTTSTSSKLLTLALPHHKSTISSYDSYSKILTNLDIDTNYTCIKGNMTFVVVTNNKCIMYSEPLLPEQTNPVDELATITKKDEKILKLLKATINKDKTLIIPTATDIYGFGKQIFRMGQLALVSNKILNQDNKDIIDILYKYLTNFLDYNINKKDNLVYDMTIGGIVSTSGIRDKMSDFGNGYYNDHHFHYGYIIYASSILAKYNSTFLEKYGSKIDYLVSDVANPKPLSASGSNLFPFTRHKSWYDGHSWASGLFPLSNGKSQESSSEAINCYYAVYLWSTIRSTVTNKQSSTVSTTNNNMLSNFARLLLSMEIKSVKTYWHTGPNNPIYKPYSINNNYMMGNIGMLDVTSTVWFGDKTIYVHLINTLPISPITSQLFDETYVKGEYEKILKPNEQDAEISWKGYLICLKAILYPKDAWNDAVKLIPQSYQLDSAISISYILYWIATRPMASDDSPWNITIPAGIDIVLSSGNSDSSAACMNNAACNEYGLEGLCCPTAKGVFLGCCQDSGTLENDGSTTSSTTPKPSKQTVSCDSHPLCSGLKGDCCPTSDGFYLGCCTSNGNDDTNTGATDNSNGDTTTTTSTNDDNDDGTASTTTNTINNDKIKPSTNNYNNASCSNYSKCSSLDGDCCPTSNGNYLNCCYGDKSSTSNTNSNNNPKKNKPTVNSSVSSCESHPLCSGLKGDCCPTSHGDYLTCCSSTN